MAGDAHDEMAMLIGVLLLGAVRGGGSGRLSSRRPFKDPERQQMRITSEAHGDEGLSAVFSALRASVIRTCGRKHALSVRRSRGELTPQERRNTGAWCCTGRRRHQYHAVSWPGVR